MLKKIVIANRGEIAVRLIHACKELGIKSVSLYSDVDSKAMHVQMADESYNIGPAPAVDSYLNIEKIIEIALTTNADAIHPGYGFLAENSIFAQRCEKENIVFIGPSSAAMSLVGDKIRARETVARADVPLIPGMHEPVKNVSELRKYAEKLGYPVLLKAAAGGGGKGMRIIYETDDLSAKLDSAMREAKAAFGDDSVYLEKYVDEPRHIEIQILSDNFGNMIYLGERECSIQRRHQKIIEESPSVAISDDIRKKMGETALRVVKATNYTNAGTVEFLLDKNNFYFLEVNARLQVEHPVTEMVTGIDLVKQQIKIASNEKLTIKQSDVKSRGHAIECRIYAEDPEREFLPATGIIRYLQEPKGPWIRNDTCLFEGLEVSIHYDPILAKLIVWGEDRIHAIEKLKKALDDYVIMGVKNQLPFLRDVVNSRAFREGATYTNFIDVHFSGWKPEQNLKNIAIAGAAIHDMIFKKEAVSPARKEKYNPWTQIGSWEL